MKAIIRADHTDPGFVDQVNVLSGTNVGLCFHCRSCANGCPFVEAMDYAPHGVFRLVQFGLREEAFSCSTIWICVGCHTCSIQCPMAIDIPAVMDAICQMALEQGIEAAEPDILRFHREVIRSIGHYGRTHKLEIMLRYKLGAGKWFEDMDVGLRMLAKRKLDIRPSRIQKMKEIEALFQDSQYGGPNV